MSRSLELNKHVDAEDFTIHGEILGAETPEERLARLRREMFALSESPMSDTDYMAGSGHDWKKLRRETIALERKLNTEFHDYKND
ncbi:MAG TPA: hypothetical protein VFM68_02245 [Candidatus Saccharimonadales bacterium]|nr:hypothetical protein [Candidatus Saccharimonadales bacterium]